MSKKSNTTLLSASFGGEIETVKTLLSDPSIDVNIINNVGNTALILASYQGHNEVVQTLLSAPSINVNKYLEENEVVYIEENYD